MYWEQSVPAKVAMVLVAFPPDRSFPRPSQHRRQTGRRKHQAGEHQLMLIQPQLERCNKCAIFVPACCTSPLSPGLQCVCVCNAIHTVKYHFRGQGLLVSILLHHCHRVIVIISIIAISIALSLSTPSS